jgi:hypothetical protein
MKIIAAYAIFKGAMMSLLPQTGVAGSLQSLDLATYLNVGNGRPDPEFPDPEFPEFPDPEFQAKGLTIRSTIDCVIAQVCLRDGQPLLAKDRDFDRIAQLVALKLLD